MSEGERRYTPGPWRVGSKVGRTIYRGREPDDLIGVMDRREDAHLAAAAPVLLEALDPLHDNNVEIVQAATSLLRVTQEGTSAEEKQKALDEWVRVLDESQRLLEQARDAIAKATNSD